MIRWHETAAQIDCRIRGVSPKPGAFATIKAKRVKLWDVKPAPDKTDAEPGTILAIGKDPPGLLVAAGNGTVALLREAQPDNGRRMAAADWARGLRIAAGDRFEKEDSRQ